MAQDDANLPERRRPDQPRSGWLRLISIRLLRATISTLEQTVEQLEAPTNAPAIAPQRSRWAKLLRWVRLRLPVSWNRVLGNQILSGLIVLVLLFPMGLIANLFASLPAGTTPTPTPPTSQPDLIGPQLPQPFPPERKQPIATPPSPLPSPAPAPTPTPAPVPPPQPTVSPGSPTPQRPQPFPPERPANPTVTPFPTATPSPLAPKPAPIPSPTPTPTVPETPAPGPVSFTETLQAQLTAITAPYAPRLLLTVQPNFKQSWLVIQLEDGWFDLDRSQQDELANALWQQAQDLNFRKLDLTTRQNWRLARSPVVGDAMIVLRRKPE
jgi:hypothetical protein